MRKIHYIVIHCTATAQTATVENIQKYWKNGLGWNNPGYHHLIKYNGEVVDLQPIEKVANGVSGHNYESIHISYMGGIDEKGKPIDNRTPAQIRAMIELVKKYQKQFPASKVLGHRDFLGVKKACPSFDVARWLKTI